MTQNDNMREVPLRFQLPALEEQVDLVETHGLETLLFCPDSWALRHVFIDQETGETVRARCNRWDCLYCGPRKVDQWRQLVKAAEPTLFITLTKAGKTVEEAARALTTFLQYLRRGSKGRGLNHVGAREAYPVEYFAVLERHSDFEENGFHWHLLVKGAIYIPAATILLSMGVHPKVVQELLGHSQISMTMDIYSHVLPSMQQEAMGRMGDVFGRDDQEGDDIRSEDTK